MTQEEKELFEKLVEKQKEVCEIAKKIQESGFGDIYVVASSYGDKTSSTINIQYGISEVINDFEGVEELEHYRTFKLKESTDKHTIKIVQMGKAETTYTYEGRK